MSKVAFIGLGQMGKPMACNLAKGGFEVSGYNSSLLSSAEFLSLGIKLESKLENAVRGAEFIITMLPNGKVVEQVYLGNEGISDVMDSSSLAIDMSTISPFESDDICLKMSKLGLSFMDAPVGRTSAAAAAGNLLIFAGGSASQIERAGPLFSCMGEKTFDVGGLGKGVRVKLINNYMSIALNALSAEVMALSEKLGLDYDMVQDVFSGTPAGNGHFDTTWPSKVLKGDLSPNFMLKLAHKDLGIAIDVANCMNTLSPMGAAAREMFSLAKISGRGEQDWTAIFEQYKDPNKIVE